MRVVSLRLLLLIGCRQLFCHGHGASATHHHHHHSTNDGDDTFARCGTPNGRDKEGRPLPWQTEFADLVRFYQQQQTKTGRRLAEHFQAEIPVYYHVIRPDEDTQYVTVDHVKAQHEVLNASFQGTGFTFRMVLVTGTANADWFTAAWQGPEDFKLKEELHQGGLESLNVYIRETEFGTLGVATIPDIWIEKLSHDGVLVRWDTLPGVRQDDDYKYGLGMTLVHEVGHWLNLFHTWGALGCLDPYGDFVDDTRTCKHPKN